MPIMPEAVQGKEAGPTAYHYNLNIEFLVGICWISWAWSHMSTRA